MRESKSKLQQKYRRRRGALLLGALAISTLAGALPAEGAGMGDCPEGEYIRMVDPVVTVVDGPGDPEEEQAQWLSWEAYLAAPLEITLGEARFDLERVP